MRSNQYTESLRLAAADKFNKAVTEAGGIMLSEYVNSKVLVLVRCSQGHELFAVPNYVNLRGYRCGGCSKNSPKYAELRFRERAEKDGVVIISNWHGTSEPLIIKCANGHTSTIHPYNVFGPHGWCSQGICKNPTNRLYLVFNSTWAKIGTSSSNRRVNDFRRKGYTHQRTWDDLLPQTAIAIESIVLTNLYYYPKATREEFGGGHTETFPVQHITAVEKLVDMLLVDEHFISLINTLEKPQVGHELNYGVVGIGRYK